MGGGAVPPSLPGLGGGAMPANLNDLIEEAARFLKLFGIRDAAVTAEIYRYITETPANYLKYYVGYLNFLDLKEEQQSLLGENFDLKSFHQKILEIGPVQFPVLQKYMNEKL